MISAIIPTIKKHPFDTEKLKLPQCVTEKIIIYDNKKRGAPWARNKGIEMSHGNYLFFCDDDIVVEENAIERLLYTLESSPDNAYAYGYYMRGSAEVGRKPFDVRELMRYNYITTMSLVRADVNPRFDESLKRLQDWDLWITLAKRQQYGIFVDQLIFTTPEHDGITFNGELTYQEAADIVRRKHGI